MKDIKDHGGTCVVVATNFWECTDKDGKVWWCDAVSCQPKPKHIGPLQNVRVHLDLHLMRDKETGDIVVAAPLATARDVK
jgi:hypothetical protein